MVIAIKIKEHAALSTKIVDRIYFLKGHLNFVSPLLCLSPRPLIESSIVEDDSHGEGECSELVHEERSIAAAHFMQQ